MAEKSLTYSLEPHGDRCVVHWQGPAGYEQASILDRCLKEIQNQPAKIVALDLAQVEYIGSVALGILVTLHRTLDARQGELRLVGVSPTCREVFTLCALDKVFRFFPDVAGALA